MEFNDKSISNYEDFQSSLSSTSGWDAPSQKSINPADNSNDLELFLHPPSSVHYYSLLSNTFNNDGHITLSASHSSKIYGPESCEVSSNVTPHWDGISVAESSNNDGWITSDITFEYINKLLMQEDSDEKVQLHHGEHAIRAVEEPFYRLLGHNNPPCPQPLPLCRCDHLENLDDAISKSCSICSAATDSSNSHSNHDLQNFEAPWSLSDIVNETKHFTRGTRNVELGLNVDGLSIAEKRGRDNQSLQVNATDTSKHAFSEVQCQNYPHTENFHFLKGRRSKQLAISVNGPTRDENFDRVLLFSKHEPPDEATIFREMVTNQSTINSHNNQGSPSARRKSRGKKQKKKDVVDLRTLLIHCAQAVSVNNHTLASDILNIIRHHSSINGDETQRLASCLVDCLEVRLAGTGSQLYHKLIAKIRNPTEIIKVFRLGLVVHPFTKAACYFSNKTIFDASKGKSKVHIIDFGICFGFQWPSLFELLAKRENGPPMVRITGIELPRSGFRPDQTNKNTGHLLVEYANMFNVPFEYEAISSKWETIRVEDFKIEEDVVLIVNCINRMKNLGDETVSINSARNRVLNTIRVMKPKVFVHGVVNGSYSTPFFLTRFKEVMYHYSALFDILDRTVPRDNESRMFVERNMYLCALVNVIACEGSERIERPENYKKWKSRNLNAGLEQLPLNQDIVKETRDLVEKYHKDYVINEDDQWLLMGWKGRILDAISTWKPSESYDDD